MIQRVPILDISVLHKKRKGVERSLSHIFQLILGLEAEDARGVEVEGLMLKIARERREQEREVSQGN